MNRDLFLKINVDEQKWLGILKQTRNKTKDRLFPQDSFNLNNILSMLGNN